MSSALVWYKVVSLECAYGYRWWWSRWRFTLVRLSRDHVLSTKLAGCRCCNSRDTVPQQPRRADKPLLAKSSINLLSNGVSARTDIYSGVCRSPIAPWYFLMPVTVVSCCGFGLVPLVYHTVRVLITPPVTISGNHFPWMKEKFTTLPPYVRPSQGAGSHRLVSKVLA
jgi:hypothetical protein